MKQENPLLNAAEQQALLLNEKLKNKLSVEQIVALPDAARSALTNAGVRALVCDDLLTPACLKAIKTDAARFALTNPGVQALVRGGGLTSAHLEAIETDVAWFALTNPSVQAFVRDDHLTPAHLKAIKTNAAYYVLINPSVRAFVRGSLLTPACLEAIKTDAVYDALTNAGVQALLSNNKLSIEQILALPDAALSALRDEGVQALVHDSRLTVAHFKAIKTDAACSALTNAGVQALVRGGRLTPAHFEAIETDVAWHALTNGGVQELLSNNKLRIEQILTLPDAALSALTNGGVQVLVHGGGLTSVHLEAIKTDATCSALTNRGVQALLSNNKLSIEQILALPDAAYRALMNEGVQELLFNDKLSIKQILALPDAALSALTDKGVQALVCSDDLTAAHLEAIKTNAARSAVINEGVQALVSSDHLTAAHLEAIKTDAACFALMNAGVQALVRSDRLTPAHLEAIKTDAVYDALTNAGVQELLFNDKLSIEQILALPDAAYHALTNAGVQALLFNDKLSIEQILALPDAACFALTDGCVQALVRSDHLTPAHLEAIKTNAACFALTDGGVQALVRGNHLTPAHLEAIKTDAACYALMNAGVQALVRSGDLTAAHLEAIKTNAGKDAVINGIIGQCTSINTLLDLRKFLLRYDSNIRNEIYLLLFCSLPSQSLIFFEYALHHGNETEIVQSLMRLSFEEIVSVWKKPETQRQLKYHPNLMQMLFFATACHPEQQAFLLCLNSPLCSPLSLKQGKTVIEVLEKSGLEINEIEVRKKHIIARIKTLQRNHASQLLMPLSLDSLSLNQQEPFQKILAPLTEAYLQKFPRPGGLASQNSLWERFLQLACWLCDLLPNDTLRQNLEAFLNNSAIQTEAIFPEIVSHFESFCAALDRRLQTTRLEELEGIFQSFPQLKQCSLGVEEGLDSMINALNKNPFVVRTIQENVRVAWLSIARYLRLGMEAHIPKQRIFLNLGTGDTLYPNPDMYDPAIGECWIRDASNQARYNLSKQLPNFSTLQDQILSIFLEELSALLKDNRLMIKQDNQYIPQLMQWRDVLQEVFSYPPLNLYKSDDTLSFSELMAWLKGIRPKTKTGEHSKEYEALLYELESNQNYDIGIQDGIPRLEKELREALGDPKALLDIDKVAKLEGSIWNYLTCDNPESFDPFLRVLLKKEDAAVCILCVLERKLEKNPQALEAIKPANLFYKAAGLDINIWQKLMCDPTSVLVLWDITPNSYQNQATSFFTSNIEESLLGNWTENVVDSYKMPDSDGEQVKRELDVLFTKPGAILYCLYELSRDQTREALYEAILNFISSLNTNGGLLRYETFYALMQDMIKQNHRQKELAVSLIRDRLIQFLVDKNYTAFWGTLPYIEASISFEEENAAASNTISIKEYFIRYPELLKSLKSPDHLDIFNYLFERHKRNKGSCLEYLNNLKPDLRSVPEEDFSAISRVFNKLQFRFLVASFATKFFPTMTGQKNNDTEGSRIENKNSAPSKRV